MTQWDHSREWSHVDKSGLWLLTPVVGLESMAKTTLTIKYKKSGNQYHGHIWELGIFERGKTLAELKKRLILKVKAIKNVKAQIADYHRPYHEEKIRF